MSSYLYIYLNVLLTVVPEGEMPQPDQDLLDGHFSGEHQASTDIDHKARYNFRACDLADK